MVAIRLSLLVLATFSGLASAKSVRVSTNIITRDGVAVVRRNVPFKLHFSADAMATDADGRNHVYVKASRFPVVMRSSQIPADHQAIKYFFCSGFSGSNEPKAPSVFLSQLDPTKDTPLNDVSYTWLEPDKNGDVVVTIKDLEHKDFNMKTKDYEGELYLSFSKGDKTVYLARKDKQFVRWEELTSMSELNVLKKPLAEAQGSSESWSCWVPTFAKKIHILK